MTEHLHAEGFHALWANLGAYGRQDIHYHPCLASTTDEPCDWVLVGDGRDCASARSAHVVKLLDVGEEWSGRAREGEPLDGSRRPEPIRKQVGVMLATFDVPPWMEEVDGVYLRDGRPILALSDNVPGRGVEKLYRLRREP